MTAHRFEPVDRGEGHIHRYTAACVCGWIGVHRRTEAKARKVWERHEQSLPSRRPEGGPREPTPADELPDELR